MYDVWTYRHVVLSEWDEFVSEDGLNKVDVSQRDDAWDVTETHSTAQTLDSSIHHSRCSVFGVIDILERNKIPRALWPDIFGG